MTTLPRAFSHKLERARRRRGLSFFDPSNRGAGKGHQAAPEGDVSRRGKWDGETQAYQVTQRFLREPKEMVRRLLAED